MIGYQSTALSLLALAGFVATASDVQAFGKRKRGNDCDCAAPCDPCATGASSFRADAIPGSAPLAMPARSTDVVPANGTRIPPTAGVIPASGTVPAIESYYFDPRTGTYYPRGQSFNSEGFVPGVIQGSTGNWYYPSTTPANYAGRRVGGLFRR